MKVYIASPGFTPDQIKIIHSVEDVLGELGIKNYSPFRDGIKLKPDATQKEKFQVFNENINNILSCDTMIAIIDDRDTGTTFEQGVFYSQWISRKEKLGNLIRSLEPQDLNILRQSHPRLISYLSKPKNNISVMLTEASMKLCIGGTELKEYLELCLVKGIEVMNRDDDSFNRVLTH